MHKGLAVIFCTSLASTCFAQSGGLMPELPERQNAQALPPLAVMLAAVDTFYAAQTTIQTAEVAQSKKYRWLAYMPNPGYSPFVGGFNVSFNLTGPLQEVRLNHTARQKVKYLDLANAAAARDLKNEVTADYYAVENLIETHTKKTRLDSLESLATQLVERKYQKNELTPTQYIAEMKAHELFLVTRYQDQSKIKDAIHTLLLKAKMDVAANNAHLFFDHP